MSRRRHPGLAALAAALGTMAVPAIANAGITGVVLAPGTSTFGCADVTAATTSLQGTLSLPGGPSVRDIAAQPATATACAGGAGRSIRFGIPRSPRTDGMELAVRGDDETAPITVLLPTARTEGATLHLRDLTPGSSIGMTAITGTALDIPAATPDPRIAIPVSGRIVTVRPDTGYSVYFYVSTSPERTTVQVNSPAPGVPVLVEGRDPGGALLFSRSLPASPPGADDVPAVVDAPPIPSGGTVRVAQQGVVDRTRRFGTSTFTQDGFRIALPADANRGSFSTQLALHAPSPDPADPLGPCTTLATTGPLPSECAPLTAPRVAVQATGLLPVAGDRMWLTTTYADSSDYLAIEDAQRGIGYHTGEGRFLTAGIAGPFAAALTLPGGRVLRHRGVAGDGEDAGGPLGRDPFPVRAVTGSRLQVTAGAVSLAAPIALTATETGGLVSGNTTPGARVRIEATRGNLRLGDITVTAGPDGAFGVRLPAAPRDALLQITSGDAATRSMNRLYLMAGHRPVRITGAADGAPARGVVRLAADVDDDVTPQWLVDSQWPGVRGRTHEIDTRDHEDGPLRVEVRDGDAADHLFLHVDNTPPSGGAGGDQRVRPGQEAVFVTGARDDGGLATVAARFGDRGPSVQVAGGAGGTLRHRFAKAGRYTVRVTLTDRAGNITQDTSVVTVASASPALRGAVPTRAARRGTVRFTQRATAAGRIRVQLMTTAGRTVLTRTTGGAAAGKPIRVSLPLTRVAPGRYLLVRQFIGDAGEVGAVKATGLTVR